MSLRETRLGNGGKGWHSCRHSPHLWHVMFGFMMKQCDVFKDEIDRLSLAKWCWLGIVENPGEGWKQTRKNRAKMKVTQLTLVVAVKAWKSSNRPTAMLAGTLQSVTATFCTIPGDENVLWTRKETRYSKHLGYVQFWLRTTIDRSGISVVSHPLWQSDGRLVQRKATPIVRSTFHCSSSYRTVSQSLCVRNQNVCCNYFSMYSYGPKNLFLRYF